MSKDKSNCIGYRYLFDSKGCSLSSYEEVKINLIVSEKYDVQIYFGPKPQYKIDSVVGGSKYYVPGTETSLGRCVMNADVSQSPEHGPFFLEIVVSTEAETIKTGNNTARDVLLKQAEVKKGEFENIINFVAGIIGLRLHRQFVLELLNKNILVWEGKNSNKGGFATPAVEILENIALTDIGIKHLKAIGEKLKTLSRKDVQEYSLIFHWLLRAWHERDILYKFIVLFIPLECILNMLSDKKINLEDKRKAKVIRMAIKKHAGDNSKELLLFFNKLFGYLSPTLDETFIELAQTAKFPRWESDIEAFRKFKRMRNDIFHGKGKDVQHKLKVDNDKESREFSDLVERYVNYFFFKDNNVYRSRWRPNIHDTNSDQNNPAKK